MRKAIAWSCSLALAAACLAGAYFFYDGFAAPGLFAELRRDAGNDDLALVLSNVGKSDIELSLDGMEAFLRRAARAPGHYYLHVRTGFPVSNDVEAAASPTLRLRPGQAVSIDGLDALLGGTAGGGPATLQAVFETAPSAAGNAAVWRGLVRSFPVGTGLAENGDAKSAADAGAGH